MRKIVRAIPLFLCFAVFFANPAFAAEPAKTKKEWTFLVFMNAFNNLDPYGDRDLNEMEKVGSTDQVNVVVQWASYRAGVVKRLKVVRDNDTSTVTSPIVENIGRVDMGDARNLVEFVKWAAEKYPAKKYFIDMWNHGSGWHKNRRGGVMKDISNDDYSGNVITTEQLGQAIRDISVHLGQKVDIYGSDACLMAMAEVAAEMKDSVEVYIGSQDLEPADGWPYDRVLAGWNAIPNATPRQVAEVLVREYNASYPQGRYGISQSAFDLSKYSAFADSIRDLGAQIQAQSAESRSQIVAASAATQAFYYDDYKDVGDFLRQLETRTSPDTFSRASIANVRTAISDFVIASQTSNDLAKATGVAFWLPESSWSYTRYADRYGALQFNSDTHWKDALRALFP